MRLIEGMIAESEDRETVHAQTWVVVGLIGHVSKSLDVRCLIGAPWNAAVRLKQLGEVIRYRGPGGRVEVRIMNLFLLCCTQRRIHGTTMDGLSVRVHDERSYRRPGKAE